MSRLRTISMLQDYLDKEFSWRLKEIADLKFSVRKSSPPRQKTAIRAGITLLYAHWEGFIKNSSEGYVNFVSNQELTYKELSTCFIVFGVKKHLQNISNSRKVHMNIVAVDFFLNKLTDRANISIKTAIDTKSNLGSKIFENIVLSIGINPMPYQTKFNLIDSSLLERRNRIAHGEYLDLAPKDYQILADEVISLLRMFKTDIENAATLKKYRRCL